MSDSNLASDDEKKDSAPMLLKKVLNQHILQAIQIYDVDSNYDLDNSDKNHELIHENQSYTPTTLLALACEFVDKGRRLKAIDFQGISLSRRFKPLETAGFEIIPNSNSPTAKDLFHLVRKKHILKAIKKFNDGTSNEFGPSTQYDLIHENLPYPPKAILGIACAEMKGGRLLRPEDFSGGEKSECFKTLKREGFKIKAKLKDKDYKIEIGKLYPVLTIVSLLKKLWETKRPKSENKYKIFEDLNDHLNEYALFQPYGPSWAASPWNQKTWLREDGENLFSKVNKRKGFSLVV